MLGRGGGGMCDALPLPKGDLAAATAWIFHCC